MSDLDSNILTGKYDILSIDEKLLFIRTLERHYYYKPTILSFDYEFEDLKDKQIKDYLECKKELSFWSKIRELGLEELTNRCKKLVGDGSLLDIYSNHEQYYSEQFLELLYPEYIIRDPSYIKNLLLLDPEELRENAENKLVKIGSNMRYIENHTKINLLLNDENIIPPPWVTFPNIKRFSIGWRMGGGEDFMHYWSLWMESLEKAELKAYLSHYIPLPYEWLGMLFNFTGYEISEKKGLIKSYEFLYEIGINHKGDYDSWENRVDHLFKTGEDIEV